MMVEATAFGNLEEYIDVEPNREYPDRAATAMHTPAISNLMMAY